MKISQALGCAFFTVLFISCGCIRKTEKEDSKKQEINKIENIEKINQQSQATPPLIIYKTRADYYDKVPVTLSCDKQRIIGYPHPTDLMRDGKFVYPTRLTGDYLLDNRGISKDIAFLKYTYEDYSKLKEIPNPDDLFWDILDKDPLLKYCNCGSRYDYDGNIKTLNARIMDGFTDCDCE